MSTKEQVEEGNSLQTQQKLCKDYALKNGYEVVQLFIERGESAKTAQRTELQKLLSYCSLRKNNVSAVIAYKLDRISRNTDDYSQIRLLLKRYDVEIKSTSEYFENTPAGRFMENIIANVAQFDNDVRTERSVGGMRDAVREGRYVWSSPLGFSNTKIGGKSNIAPNKLAILIKRAFDLVNSRLHSIDEVHRMVTREGLLTKSGKQTSKSHFHRILRNELYAGWIKKFGERHKGIFEPIISEALFNSVQNVFKQRKRTLGEYKLENPDFPLRRFVRNSQGVILTGSWAKGRRKKYPYYRFRGDKKSVRKDVLEKKFVAFINQFSISPERFEDFERSLKENLVKKQQRIRKNEASMKTTINALKEKQTLLIQKNFKGYVTDTVLKEQLAVIEKEILDTEVRLADIKPVHHDFQNLALSVSEFLKNPGLAWINAPFSQRIRLQWFEFPFGVTLYKEKFRTAKICSLFNVKDKILTQMYPRADSKEFRLNTSSLAKSPASSNSNAKLWDEIGNDLIELDDIFHPKKEGELHNEQLTITPEKYLGLPKFIDTG